MERNDENLLLSDGLSTSLTEAEMTERTDTAGKEQGKKEDKLKSVKKRKKKRPSITLILTLSTIVLFFLTIFVIRTGIKNGGRTLADTFNENYETKRQETNTIITDFWSRKVEEANKVTNEQAISITGIKEKADLEVLMVSDVVFEIENKEDNKYHLTRWVQIPGTCVYTVNLKASEFVTDTVRNTVTVRIPHIISNTHVNEDKIEVLFYKDDSDLFSSTFSKAEIVKAGNDLVDRQLRNGYIEIRRKFQENPEYEKEAKESAIKVVEKLIKDLNPENETLQVFVEFAE